MGKEGRAGTELLAAPHPTGIVIEQLVCSSYEEKKENKMKHFPVANGRFVASHELFFLFNPVP